MHAEILYQPSYATVRLTLARGEQIRAEGGAMVAMDAGIRIETGATGGFLKSLGRSLLGGESFFQNTFIAENDNVQVLLAPELPGDIALLQLRNQEMIVQSGSFLASEQGIEVSTKWGGARTFFGGEGFFMLRCAGTGLLVVSSYGAIHQVALGSGQRYIVDTGHIVAFDGRMSYQVRRAGNWKSTIFGGEGLVVEFTGPGDLWLQTRSPEAFLGWLIPRLPNQSSG
ncbi:MAG: TIGR00266 family protein [Thermomicrobiales bacterium]|nr:MAG: TIGR00266 family protein [Thermomicrobiales bacterium]